VGFTDRPCPVIRNEARSSKIQGAPHRFATHSPAGGRFGGFSPGRCLIFRSPQPNPQAEVVKKRAKTSFLLRVTAGFLFWSFTAPRLHPMPGQSPFLSARFL
jgi:hypothetical protein